MMHSYFIPDCPYCNKELLPVNCFEGEATKKHPFGTNRKYWWFCNHCGRTSSKCDTAEEAKDAAINWVVDHD